MLVQSVVLENEVQFVWFSLRHECSQTVWEERCQ